MNGISFLFVEDAEIELEILWDDVGLISERFIVNILPCVL